MLDKEVKRGSTEMLILALVEDRPRHGYEIAKLIEERSDGVLRFHLASLYPLLYRMEKRGLIKGTWIEKAGQRRPRGQNQPGVNHTMNPNWNHIVREHLAVLRLPPEREIEIVEEQALHLEAAYEDALADGLSASEAEARALRSYDWRLLECELSRAEHPLTKRALQPSLELIEEASRLKSEPLWQR